MSLISKIFFDKTLQICLAGFFLLKGILPIATADTLALTRDLYAEGQWQQCRAEAQRVLAKLPKKTEAQLYLLISRAKLNSLASDAYIDPSLASTHASLYWVARYEIALSSWRQDKYDSALSDLQEIFLNTPDKSIFLQTACALHLILENYPCLKAGKYFLLLQLETARCLWTPELFKTTQTTWLPERKSKGRLAQYAISFYRSQIAPAIGARCILLPSCSAYASRAFETYGFFIGLALTADRLVREPGVVVAAEQPVTKKGKTYFKDPLYDHTWWLKSSTKND